jgi:hypothetical protein
MSLGRTIAPRRAIDAAVSPFPSGALEEVLAACPALEPTFPPSLEELPGRSVLTVSANHHVVREGQHGRLELVRLFHLLADAAGKDFAGFCADQAALPVRRALLLQLGAREGRLDLPDLAVGAPVVGRSSGELALRRGPVARSVLTLKASGWAISPGVLPLLVCELFHGLPLLAFVASRRGHAPLCVPFPVDRLPSQRLQ